MPSGDRSAVMLGRGGQGTKLAATLVAWAGALDGLSPMHYSIYDGLIRGGNIASTIVLAPDRPGAVIRSRFDTMVAVHSGWFDRFYAKLRAGGVLYHDPAFVPEAWLLRADVEHRPVDLAGIAREAGDVRAANMAAAGVLAGSWGEPSLRALEQAVRDVTPPHRQERVDANIAAINAGWEVAARPSAARSRGVALPPGSG